MRGSIRRWLVVGALASASLCFPGCTNTNRGSDEPQNQAGTGGSGGASLEDQGMGGSGGAGLGDEGTGGSGTGGAHKGAKGTHGGGSMKPDAGTPADAGTGGAGFEGSQSTGTTGQGVTGSGTEERNAGENVYTPSGGVPTK